MAQAVLAREVQQQYSLEACYAADFNVLRTIASGQMGLVLQVAAKVESCPRLPFPDREYALKGAREMV